VKPRMSMQFIRFVFRIAGWIGVALIAILSLIPGEVRPHTMSSNQLEHVAAYLVTASALTLGYFGIRNAISIAICLPIYAAVLETLQLWVPNRMVRIIDVIASAGGSWIGVLLVVVLHWILAGPKTALPPPPPSTPMGSRSSIRNAD
jgi:VanZ family protein